MTIQEVKKDPSKIFWLKLKNNFFDQEEIKLLESTQSGKDHIIFYMKLLLKSASSKGELYFRDVIPYSPEMLATITNTNVDTAKVAVEMFLKLGLMEKWSDGTLFMVETKNMIGSETKWAQYKRNKRNTESTLEANVGQCPNNSKENPIKLELELNLNKDLSSARSDSLLSLKNFKIAYLQQNPNCCELPKLEGYIKGALLLKYGYIHNSVTGKDLSGEQAIEIWKKLYQLYLDNRKGFKNE